MTVLYVSLVCGLIVAAYYVGLRRGAKKALEEVNGVVTKRLKEVQRRNG